MTYAYHWRKAMLISICLHVFLIITAGYLMAGLTAPLPKLEEVMLEMDLVSDPAEHPGNDTTSPESVLPDEIKPPAAEMPPIQTETRVSEPEPVVTTSELSMTTAAPPTAVTKANQNINSASNNAASSPAVPAAGDSSRSGIAAPSILGKVDPVYPSSARQAGLEGTVILKVQILANGRPGEITVSRSSGHAVLDEAAITAIGKWHFMPAKDRASGQTVACTTTLPVSFRLNDQNKR
jgi:protein TonB